MRKTIVLAMMLVAILAVPACAEDPQESETQKAAEASGPTVMPLPEPVRTGVISIEYVIDRRRSIREFTDDQVALKDLSQLLWAVQGITHGSVFRAVPSAGATYPLEIFFVQMDESELEEGYYHYIPQEHQLEWANTTIDRGNIVSAFTGDDRSAVSSVSTLYFILATTQEPLPVMVIVAYSTFIWKLVTLFRTSCCNYLH